MSCTSADIVLGKCGNNMFQFNLNAESGDRQQIKSILLLGAHCDDIEIGCGASILRLIRQYPDVHWHWVVFSSNEQRLQEAQSSADAYLQDAKSKTVVIKSFRNGYFPYVGAEIKDYFEQLKKEVTPDVIFTHYRDDLHQDHRTLSQLTTNTFRDHMILEYEIMKYDGDVGQPNFFMPAAEQDMNKKIDLLFQCYPSQHDKQWFTRDTFKALMRLRGIEANADTGFAEAFYCRKACL